MTAPRLVALSVLFWLSATASVAVAESPTGAGTMPLTPVAGVPSRNESTDAEQVAAWTATSADATTDLAWADYDLDGDLDLLVANNGDNRLYRNSAQELSEVWTFDSQSSSSVAWGDYDQDGYLDLAVGNMADQDHIYHNQGNGNFGLLAGWSPPVQDTTSVAWAGWGEGAAYRSYLALGISGGANLLYRYEDTVFALVDWDTAATDSTQSMAWGDYDKDGDPDLAVGNIGQANRIYQNLQSINNPLSQVQSTTEMSATNSMAWGDINGDGYLDLAVGNGDHLGTPEADQVYCNSGPPTYLLAVCWTSADKSSTRDVSWGDYDGDGDLDLIAASEIGFSTRVYLNTGGVLDSTATEPFGDAAIDGRAAAWGDWDGDGDVDLALGYWDAENVVYENTRGAMVPIRISDHEMDTRSLAWGDMDGNGWLDLAVGNSSSSPTQVFTSTGDALALAWTSPEAHNTRSVAWGDFDGDGDQDLATGNGALGAGQQNRIYVNSGQSLSSSWPFGPAYDTRSVAWGDFDGDQDLDLAVGNYGTDQPNQIFISGVQGGTPGFTGTVTLDPATDRTCKVTWADFDQDTDLDLAVGNANGPNRVYVNDGDGSFPTSITLPGNDPTYDIAWGDWDGDGDLDLAVGNSGWDGFVQIQAAEESGGAWAFRPVFTSTGIALDVRSVAWGDYDGDGDLDLAVGTGTQRDGRNLIFRNEGGSLVQTWIEPVALADDTWSVAWADWDRDGDLDLAVGGATLDKTNHLYVNTHHARINLANNPTFVSVRKPGDSCDAWFFASQERIGTSEIDIYYTLYDDEGDRAFLIEPQVSWDGGGHWETAWQSGGEGTTDLVASAYPTGTEHIFAWDALSQMLSHQAWTIPALPDKPDEEMDVAFRIAVWSNPDHGGDIQAPSVGSSTTLTRLDLRPDWRDAVKLAARQILRPDETLQFTLQVTQTGHGMPDGGSITDHLPAGLTLSAAPTATTGNIEWTPESITWTGELEYLQSVTVLIEPQVARPLTDGLTLENCAIFNDGLHEPASRCTSVVVDSDPDLTGSFQQVNGQSAISAYPGETVTYTIVLTDTGTDNARDARMTSQLPTGVLWVDRLAASSGATTYDDGEIAWSGDVQVFEPVTITYQVVLSNPLDAGTIISSPVWVTDGISPGAILATPATITVLGSDLLPSSMIACTDSVEMGDILTYTIVLVNAGIQDAKSVSISNPLPANGSYVPNSFWASSPQGGYDPVAHTITWIGTVDAGSPVTLTFAITAGCPTVPGGVNITNLATITDSVGIRVPLLCTTEMRLPDLTASAKSAYPPTIRPGDSILYSLALHNSGGYAPAVWFEDLLPVEVTWTGTYTAPQGTLTYDPAPRLVSWTGVSLEHNQAVTVSFMVDIGQISSGSLISNTATIGYPCGSWTRAATAHVAWYSLYLPTILKSSLP